MHQSLFNLLEKEPRARERKYKARAISRVLQARHESLRAVSVETIDEVVGDTLSLDREWRKILLENPHLRGTDYDDKNKLENEAKIRLGYVQASLPVH